MDSVIVLAMHGAPPRDFAADELNEFFGLHARAEVAAADSRRRRPSAITPWRRGFGTGLGTRPVTFLGRVDGAGEGGPTGTRLWKAQLAAHRFCLLAREDTADRS
jgi:hypothetical protein